MESSAIAVNQPQKISTKAAEENLSLNEQIIRFYEEAGIDYGHWSRNFNMHFGYYHWGFNPFNRERMLEQMNLEVAKRLDLDAKESPLLVDMGCGVGATARCIARNYPNVKIKGANIVPWQIEKATQLAAQENLQAQVEFVNSDYRAMPFDDETVDGVWAVESSCHAEGADKERVISEMARVLKKDGRFVVADCFIKRPEKKFNPLMKRCYKAICKNWVLPEMATLDYFVAALERNGMKDVQVEDISWRIAPSVAHAPFAVTTFIIKKLLTGEPLKQRSINNLKGSLLSLLLGTNRSKFSYCLISGTRS